jgi:transposase
MGKSSGHPLGERNANARLSEQDVRAVRSLFATGKYSRVALAKMFKVSAVTISNVITRYSWAHVPDEPIEATT